MGSRDNFVCGRLNTAQAITQLMAEEPTHHGVPFDGDFVLVVNVAGGLSETGALTAIRGNGFNGGAGVAGQGGIGGIGLSGQGGDGDGTRLGGPGVSATGGLSTLSNPHKDDRNPNGPGLIAKAGGVDIQPPPTERDGVGITARGGDKIEDTRNIGFLDFVIGADFAGAGVIGKGGANLTNNGLANTALVTDVGGGAGIVGIAGGTTNSPTPIDYTEVGVFGITERGAGLVGVAGSASLPKPSAYANVGVFGFSENSAGVLGSGNRGGIFQSPNAQLNLVPVLKTPPTLDYDPQIPGRLGDLLVTVVKHVEAEGNQDIAELWFCKTTDQAGNPTWVKIG